MYVPFYSTKLSTGAVSDVSNKYATISLAKFMDSIPYNSLIDVTQYYVSIGNIMFINIGVNYSSRLGHKGTINDDDSRMSSSKAGPQAPTCVL